MKSFYPIVKLDPSWVCADEAMGSKDKKWFRLPEGERWLFKYPRTNYGIPTGEHWAEKIAAEIAELINIPHAKVEFASFDGNIGSFTQRFPELIPEVELIHGNDLLPGFVLGYDRLKKFRQSNHTLKNVLLVISKVIPGEDEKQKAWGLMAGMMVLDALILNTDRHHENWALLRRTKEDGSLEYRVAPSFDHASSLGRELTESKLAEWEKEPRRVEWYAKRAPGAIFISKMDEKGADPLALVEHVRKLYPTFFIPWLERLQEVDREAFEEVIRKVPPKIMTERAKTFTLELLLFTQKELCKK